jgi:hypothetical protein
MTKKDRELIDYLGASLSLGIKDFSISYFHVCTLVYMYKKHGESFLDQLRKRAWP